MLTAEQILVAELSPAQWTDSWLTTSVFAYDLAARNDTWRMASSNLFQKHETTLVFLTEQYF